jgi:hypothetical protein
MVTDTPRILEQPDTAMLTVRQHRHWYQRLAVRLDPLLEQSPPGTARLTGVVDAWLDLALDAPGWPTLVQRLAESPVGRQEIAHQLRRLSYLIAADLTVEGHMAPEDAAAALTLGLADAAAQEAAAGRPLREVRRLLITSTVGRLGELVATR